MYSDDEIGQIVFTKSLLIAEDSSGIIDSVDNKDDFEAFLYYIAQIYNKENPFFLMGEYSVFKVADNVLNFINEFRFKYKDKDIIDVCNQMIGVLNELRAIPEEEKREKFKEYVIYQEDIRALSFDGNINELAVSMALDYAVYYDGVESIYETGFSDYSLVYGSINYFLNSFDECIEDKDLVLSIKKNLDIIKNNTKNFKLKREVKSLKKTFK